MQFDASLSDFLVFASTYFICLAEFLLVSLDWLKSTDRLMDTDGFSNRSI